MHEIGFVRLFLSNYYSRLTKNYYDLSNLEFRSTSKARYTLLQHRLYRLYLLLENTLKTKTRGPRPVPQGDRLAKATMLKYKERKSGLWFLSSAYFYVVILFNYHRVSINLQTCVSKTFRDFYFPIFDGFFFLFSIVFIFI